jgi:hypothetical protein
MHLIATRKYTFLDTETLVERQARDSLLKTGENEFLLHMTSGEALENERLISLDARCALLWINQTADEYGLNWE